MTFEQLQAWMDRLVDERRMRSEERERLLLGRQMFDDNREMIEAELSGLVVGFVGGQRLSAPTAEELLDQAGRAGRPMYFEFVPGIRSRGRGEPTAADELVR